MVSANDDRGVSRTPLASREQLCFDKQHLTDLTNRHEIAAERTRAVLAKVDRVDILHSRFGRLSQFAHWQLDRLILFGLRKANHDHKKRDQLKRHIDHRSQIAAGHFVDMFA